MRKYFIFLIFIVVAFTVSCGKPKVVETSKPKVKARVIIESKGSSLGVSTPVWVEKGIDSNRAVESLPQYSGKYSFFVTQTGTDLDFLRAWAGNFNASVEVSGRIDTAVMAEFEGGLVGEKDKAGKYFKNYVKVETNMNFTGFYKESDWWVKFDDGSYDYYILFLMDKKMLDSQIERYLDLKAIGLDIDPDVRELILKAKEIIINKRKGLN